MWGNGVPLGALAFILVGCAPPLDSERPAFPFAGRWQSSMTPGAPRLIDNVAWWRSFRDAPLDRLVSMALTDSPTLEAARARSSAASAAAGAIPGALTLSGGVGAAARTRSGGSPTLATEADFGALLLFDPGRGRTAEHIAVGARAVQAEATMQASQLLLIARVTETYLDLRLAQTRQALAESTVARRRQTLALASQLVTAGESTRLDTLRAEARIADITGDLPRLRAAVDARVAELAVLAGRAPGSLPPDLDSALRARGPQPRAILSPDPGIPADLLRNRPDIRAAEAGYDAARGELGQARAALYPRLSLSGTIEVGSGKARSLNFGPALRLPVLPDKATRATVSAREARVAEAHAEWRAAVLAALLEVETALLDYRAAVATEAATERAASLYREGLTLTRELVTEKQATLSDLIEAEDTLARAEDSRAAAQAARAQGFARLNLRLGAGAKADRLGTVSLGTFAPKIPGKTIKGHVAGSS